VSAARTLTDADLEAIDELIARRLRVVHRPPPKPIGQPVVSPEREREIREIMRRRHARKMEGSR
jgi:hypothetical protein